jgi:NAD(P)H-hydrate epimerase
MGDELSAADVIIAGPGLGRTPGVMELVKALIRQADAPMVLDADALFAVASDTAMLNRLKRMSIITPHPGEMSRLTGCSVDRVLCDTINTAVNFARQHNVVTLLKDARTIVAEPGGQVYVNVTGSPALAKAGTGDVLAGIAAAFMAQGLDAYTAACLAAYVHGKTGEYAARKLSAYGVNASDLLTRLPVVLRKLIKNRKES